MHDSSYQFMRRVVGQYLDPTAPLVILDVGSRNVSGSYRPLFAAPWRYIGLDVMPGPNVDLVLDDPYQFPIESASVDVVVSGQAFEHIEFFWLTWAEIVRVLRPGGWVFLVAPSRGREHRAPVDCWRFYPDGFRALAKLGQLDLLEVGMDASPPWGDTAGAFRKPPVLSRLSSAQVTG